LVHANGLGLFGALIHQTPIVKLFSMNDIDGPGLATLSARRGNRQGRP
jgi:hypothetical protein